MLNASLTRGFLVGGTSAGATLAASVALRARDDAFFAPGSGREITGQLLQTPQVVHPEAEIGRYVSSGISHFWIFQGNLDAHVPYIRLFRIGMHPSCAQWRNKPTRPS